MSKRVVTVVSHTHWDRAWYCTFQEFRVRLVRLVDRLLDLMEKNPEFKVFMLDGQTAILEDYLEVRPGEEARLVKLAQSGRISVGPWYVLPDEFLVSPESIIRNLALGHRMGRKYGGALEAGYVPDGFGHIAQLPQIFRGFDIDSAFFWRGMGGEDLGTEFEWVAPDGSAVTAIFMPWGYHNLSNFGFVIRWGDTSQMELDETLAVSQVRKAIADLEKMATTPALLLMNGIDHAEAEPRVPELLRRVSRKIPEVEIRQGTILDHLRSVRQAGVPLRKYRGEFRWGRYSEVLQGVYSTRIGLKQRNHEVENLLERVAEPLAAIAWLSGAEVPVGTQDLIGTAWKWLLKNHPHDDIYGSGIDQVHHEMGFRFDQAAQIAEVVARDSVRQLGRRIDFSAQPGVPVLVHNALGWERRGTVTADIDLDFDDPDRRDFSLHDHTGAPMPFQILDRSEHVWLEPLKPNRKHRVSLAFPVEVPACGYTTVYVRPAGARVEARGTWVVEKRSVENEWIAVRIEDNGSLTLKDKRTGVVHTGLGVFEDVDDAGDEYSSSPSPEPLRLDTTRAAARIRSNETGPCLATFSIRVDFDVPRELAPDRQRRGKATTRLALETVLTIYRDSPVVHLETTVDNTARDHKLSVLFPTAYRPHAVQVDQAFAVLDRDIDLPRAVGWVEDPTPLQHERSFVDLSDGVTGLAVANRGLPSVEVRRTESGTEVALTLLRAVGWLSRDDLVNRRVAAGPLLPTPGAQCLGRHVFRYAVLPHAGDWRAVYRDAHTYDTPLTVTRADTHEGMVLKEMPFIGVDLAYADRTIRPIPWPRGGVWPTRQSILTADPDGLVLSSLARSERGDGVIARYYNPDTERGGRWRLRAAVPIRESHLVNFRERRLAPLVADADGAFTLEIPPGGVVSVELVKGKE